MKELVNILFGGLTLYSFIGYFIWAMIGAFVYSTLEMSERDVKSKKTPEKFSLKFWIMDNWRRWVTTLLFIFILFRFYSELTGQQLVEFTAFLTGFGSDGISGFTKKKLHLIQADRERLIQHRV